MNWICTVMGGSLYRASTSYMIENWKTLWRIKASSCKCVIYRVHYSFQNLKTESKIVLGIGEREGMKRSTSHAPELSQDPPLHQLYSCSLFSLYSPSLLWIMRQTLLFITQFMLSPSMPGTADEDKLCCLSTSATALEGGRKRGDSGLEENSVKAFYSRLQLDGWPALCLPEFLV